MTVPAYLASAGEPALDDAVVRGLTYAMGVWIPALRIVLVDAGHQALRGLDDSSYEAMVARTAWHEWGHALSVQRASEHDIADGRRLLDLAPEGVQRVIRNAGYRPMEHTHEVVAETYALLMALRRRGARGQPSWLADELVELMRRVCGWHE